mgnify:CR=1 FL=1
MDQIYPFYYNLKNSGSIIQFGYNSKFLGLQNIYIIKVIKKYLTNIRLVRYLFNFFENVLYRNGNIYVKIETKLIPHTLVVYGNQT